jgi:hypothetical protein
MDPGTGMPLSGESGFALCTHDLQASAKRYGEGADDGFGLRNRFDIILREGLADCVRAGERVPSGREVVDQHIHVGRHPPHGLACDVLGIFPEMLRHA